MSRTSTALQAGLAAVALLLGASAAAAQEQATIEAFSAWEIVGEATQTGADEATYVGTLGGSLFVQTERGPIAAGRLNCPVVLRVNLGSGAQEGSGRCAMILEGGDQVFAELTCKGVHLVGCEGTATLTGGAGRFAGATGGGDFVIRSSLQRSVMLGSGTVETVAEGIIYWPALSYSIPAQ